MSWRSRFFEYRAYRALLNEYFERDPNFIWTAAPKPTMNGSLYHSNFPDYAEKIREEFLEKRIYCHTETEPIFDAADIVRLGRDLFVRNCFTANRKGYDWLRRHFNKRGLRVHLIDLPKDLSPVHLDADFVPLSSTMLMINPVRPPRDWVIRMFEMNGWKVIYGTSNGLQPPPMSQCSPWLSLNVLSLDDKRMIVEAQETNLMELLSKHGFEPIPVPFRSMNEFGGGLHCSTTDVRREGPLKSYFPHIDELEAKGLECQFAPFGGDSPEPYKP